jgi:hypothetical protein
MTVNINQFHMSVSNAQQLEAVRLHDNHLALIIYS